MLQMTIVFYSSSIDHLILTFFESYRKSLKGASTTGLSSDEFPPPLLERLILKRFGFLFLQPRHEPATKR
jgi:hypothetical protein